MQEKVENLFFAESNHLFAVAVVAGDDDGRVLQLVLQVHVGGEDDAAAGNQRALHLVHVLHGLRAQSESHASQSGQCHAVAFGCPRLDHLTGCIPAGLHHTLALAAPSIDGTTAVQDECRAELARAMLSRSPQSPLASQLQRQR